MAEPKEPLTERELEVVQLLTTGVSNKEIAAQLNVSPNTIRVHLRNIFTKLEAQSRTEVTMIAVRNGWVEAGAQVSGVGDEGSVAELAPVPAQQVDSPTPDAWPLAPAQPVPVPVPVAPNPLPLPPLAVWKRVTIVIALIAALGLTGLALQRAPVATGATESEALLPDGLSDPVIAAQPSEDTRWYPRASVRTARARSAIAAARGNVYVIGGEVDRAPSAEVLIYEPRDDAWQDGGRKPTPVMNTGAATISNTIYVPGGTTPGALATDRFEALDLTSGEWRALPPLPQPLAGHAVVAANNKLYVIGGRSLTGASGAVYAFDPAANRWSALPALPTPRSQLAAAVANGRIYAIGGYDGRRELATCEYFQLSEGRWHTCAPMTIPRGGLGLAQVGAGLYAVGGGLTNFIAFNERYDTVADKWTSVELPSQRLGDWRNMGVASLPTAFYVIGGTTRGVPLSDNFVYEVLSNRTFIPALETSEDK
jgi:DNA-binding CsgD family transcriptional regulator